MNNPAVFTKGSTLKHVMVMTSTTSMGVMALFLVDLADMFFLSLLGEIELAAAIGYAGTILFFTTSISVGISISTAALISRSIGEKNTNQAKSYAINVMSFGALSAFLMSCVIWLNIPFFLDLLGANGDTKQLAINYLQIIIPSMVVLTIAMSGTGALRGAGDAKHAMLATVIGALVNLIFDPIFIFGLDLGIQGAAYASVVSRFAVAGFALYYCINTHKLIGKFTITAFFNDLPSVIKITIPAMLTNISTPIGNAYLMAIIANFGDSAVAGMSIIGRLTPVAFATIFALSGAIGPIVGQNYGANQIDRVRSTIKDGIKFATIFVSVVSLVLFFSQNWVISTFKASGDAAALVALFCTWLAITFLFNGFLFIANAAFNNLGYPHYSTIFNFLKATVGTIPFVYFGAQFANQSGAIIGQGIGTVLIGCIALFLCFRVVSQIENLSDRSSVRTTDSHLRLPRWPFSNSGG